MIARPDFTDESLTHIDRASQTTIVDLDDPEPGPTDDPPVPTSISLSANSIQLEVGASVQLTATVLDQAGVAMPGAQPRTRPG